MTDEPAVNPVVSSTADDFVDGLNQKKQPVLMLIRKRWFVETEKNYAFLLAYNKLLQTAIEMSQLLPIVDGPSGID
jgi:hypothetical protein